jgi:hypothetical protein
MVGAGMLSVFLPLKNFAQNKLLKLSFFIEIEVPKKYDPEFRKSESSSVDIKEINEQYLREGKILSIDVKEGADSNIYRYKFANYDIYREWNDKVYHQNAPLKQNLADNGTKFKKFF